MPDGDDGDGTQRNVFGGPLGPCSHNPKTGFYRTGCCHTGPEDRGLHTVCVVLTGGFLAYSKRAGNDLSTPMPQYGFEGLKPGQQWCLCAARWKQAYDDGHAPRVVLGSTHEATLEVVPLEQLMAHANDVQ